MARWQHSVTAALGLLSIGFDDTLREGPQSHYYYYDAARTDKIPLTKTKKETHLTCIAVDNRPAREKLVRASCGRAWDAAPPPFPPPGIMVSDGATPLGTRRIPESFTSAQAAKVVLLIWSPIGMLLPSRLNIILCQSVRFIRQADLSQQAFWYANKNVNDLKNVDACPLVPVGMHFKSNQAAYIIRTTVASQ